MTLGEVALCGVVVVAAAVAVWWSSDVLPQLMASLAVVRWRRGLRGGPCSWDVCAVDDRADIVVAGAGHNSLIAACYLAKAGYRCLVLDARHVPGGGASTEEILLPGYGIDTCATGHTLIRVNPLLTGDELGLIADYGLRYIDPDPVAHVAFPDGEQLTMWLDRDHTAAEIARFSAADSAAYLRLLDDYDQVKSVFSESQFTPVGFGPSLDARLAGHPRGRLWQRRRALSAWDVIRHEFGSRHVRAFMLWMAFQTNQAVDVPGSGVLAYSLIFGRQQRSWSILAGGSGRLTEALTGYLHRHGSTVLCDKRVTRLLLDGDRCAGVETADGGQYRAGKAVLSTIHVTQLRDMAPARAWPEEFHYGIDTYDVGIPGFGVYLATSAPPEFAARDGGSHTAVSAGTAGWPEDIIRLGQDLRAGRFVADVPWLLVATPTLADPARAPSGKHTVKLLSQQVYQLPAGMPGWDVVKARHAKRQLEHLRSCAPGFTDDVILAQLVKSPADYEQLNPHMVHGAFHGGDRGVAQTGPLRPVPGWASHRMPIAGLYQTGATTHPGGSITGAPGRNAAIVMLHDLGHDPAEVMSALPASGARGDDDTEPVTPPPMHPCPLIRPIAATRSDFPARPRRDRLTARTVHQAPGPPGLARPEACPGRYLVALRYARGGCTVTASRRRVRVAESGVTPGSGIATWPGADGPVPCEGSCMRKYVIMGIQGSGKGTHAKMLAEGFDLEHIAVGDIFRWNVQHHTKLGAQVRRTMAAGLLVGDDLVDSVVKQRLSEHDWNYGFIIDGFPRNERQAEFFLESYDIDGVIHLDLPDSEVARRVLARRLCAGCGMDYSLIDNSPSSDGRCDACGGELIRREDDTEEALAVRLREYHGKTNPVLEIFRRKEYVITVDSRPGKQQVQQAIRDSLGLPPSHPAAAGSQAGAR